ncbi:MULTISPECIES: hypothetical protein [Paenibacillus]|uniref:hypothetical protein n=1 Tax=Paenibacillus TaxID=44249 RepID=UPI000C9ED1EC|nr:MULTISPECIES: hypothetical protein [Paenibacillus]MDY7991538.1 hypothetical protein [Paenibacillus polymyxa]MDY8117979.1 hypothetical protein [Paenibacillus polymyxa]PNQ82571.1 hypothetical protein C1T21_04980 [Paenibacillus sp. F4]
MTKIEFLKQLEEQVIMPDDEGSLSTETTLDQLDEWDSLAKVAFLAFSVRELAINLNPAQVDNCVTVQDLMNLVAEKIEA